MLAKQERFRFGGSKVKTGCVTCKSRRVKCDEKRPICSQCQHRKIPCEGYQHPAASRGPPRNTFVLVSFIRPPIDPLPALDAREKRSLDFFASQTSPGLAGHEDGFSSCRWSKAIVQRACCDAAVRYATIAVGAIHEQLLRETETDLYKDAFAVQQYRKAVQCVIGIDVQKSPNTYDTMLTSSILFTIFEIMHCRYKIALQHFVGAVKMLVAEQQRGWRDTLLDQFPGQILRTIFSYLDSHDIKQVDAVLHPLAKPTAGSLESRIPVQFTSADQAQASLSILLYDLRCFFNQRDAYMSGHAVASGSLERSQGDNDPVFGSLHEMHAQLTTAFYQWTAALANSSLPSSSCSVIILRMSHLMHAVVLRYDPESGESGWDAFLASFQQIVHLGDLFLLQKHSHRKQDRNPPNTGSPRRTFTFSRGILQPLTFVAHRCRYPEVRRHALRLMEQCERIEPSWNSAVAALVAKRIIEIEEAGLDTVSAIDGYSNSGTSAVSLHTRDPYVPLPSEVSRIVDFEKMLTYKGCWKVIYRLSGSSNLHFDELWP